MAQENKWVNADIVDGKIPNAALVGPGKIFGFASTFEIAAADDNGSIYKIARLPSNCIPLRIEINNDAITAGTDYDLGLYDEDELTASDADLFVDGADLSSAHAMGSELSGMSALDVSKIGSKLYILAGDSISAKQQSYILALTANTVGTAAGTISIRGWFLQG